MKVLNTLPLTGQPSIRPLPTPSVSVGGGDEPTFREGEQPFRFFLSDASNAQSMVRTAASSLQTMGGDMQVKRRLALESALKGMEYLSSALDQKAPEDALAAAREALKVLSTARLSLQRGFEPGDVPAVLDRFGKVDGLIDTAISNAGVMFAL